MKGNLAGPWGTSKSKPTWSNTSGCSTTSVFSRRRGAVATARAALDANARKARKTYRFSKDRQVHETMTYLTLYGYNFCQCVRTLRLKDEDGR
jgi:hypothetical protein